MAPLPPPDLSPTPSHLTRSFSRSQVNRDNPLGHKGELADVYARLIRDIWSGRYTKVTYPLSSSR